LIAEMKYRGGAKEFNYTIFQAHDYIVAFSVILEPSKKIAST